MLRTETEAAETWCPMARGFEGESRTPNSYRMCRCIGGRCNWWEWAGPVIPKRLWLGSVEGRQIAEPTRPSNVPASWVWVPYKEDDDPVLAHWLEPMAEAALRRQGYCGLVGRGS